METFPKDPFEMVKARRVSGDGCPRGDEGGWVGGGHI